MARSRSRSQSPRGGARGGSKREAKSKKSAAAAAAEVEVVEEEKGLGIDDGMTLITTVLLIAAFVLIDYVLGTEYGKGTGIFGG